MPKKEFKHLINSQASLIKELNRIDAIKKFEKKSQKETIFERAVSILSDEENSLLKLFLTDSSDYISIDTKNRKGTIAYTLLNQTIQSQSFNY